MPVGSYDGLKYWPPVERTILPLSDYADIAGINPVQFMSGHSHDNFIGSGCTDRWLQYPWQGGERVSRFEISQEIARAERDIAAELGYWPAPVWNDEGEEKQFPQYHRREYVGTTGIRHDGRAKSIRLSRGKFIEGGQRTVEAVDEASVSGGSLVYSDEDSDGLYETATIQLSTSLTNTCEIKVFYAGYEGKPEYEIRPLRHIDISGGTLTIVLDAWLLFDPDKLAAFPGREEFDWLDPTTTSDFATSVDVYRVYNDPTTSATLLWERHPKFWSGNTYGDLDSQTAALVPRDRHQGMVVPMPGTYSDGSWASAEYVAKREPDRVIAYYRSGLQEEKDVNGCWVMPGDLARAVAAMATARIARPLCTKCENVRAWEEEMREDLIFVTTEDATRFVPGSVTECPFGTRRGELEAWRIVSNRLKEGRKRVSVAIL